jgi:excisionase family DNA binding protein
MGIDETRLLILIWENVYRSCITVNQKGTLMPRATGKKQGEILSRQTCTVDELAEVLGCGRGQAYDFVKLGKIRSIKIGRRLLVPTVAIQEFLTGSAA